MYIQLLPFGGWFPHDCAQIISKLMFLIQYIRPTYSTVDIRSVLSFLSTAATRTESKATVMSGYGTTTSSRYCFFYHLFFSLLFFRTTHLLETHWLRSTGVALQYYLGEPVADPLQNLFRELYWIICTIPRPHPQTSDIVRILNQSVGIYHQNLKGRLSFVFFFRYADITNLQRITSKCHS